MISRHWSSPAIERGSFIRKVYSLFTLAVIVTGASATAACLFGTPVMVGDLSLPPAVAVGVQHPIIMALSFIGFAVVSAFTRGVRGLNLMALGALSAVAGLFLAPAIYLIQMKANAGHTLSPQPVIHAFALSSTAFVGLTSYALLSGRDFSGWGGFLSMGLWTVIGAGILNIFLGGQALSLAIASVTILLFGAYILYDTGRMLDKGEDDAVDCALQLYLDFLNLFVSMLRIFGASKD